MSTDSNFSPRFNQRTYPNPLSRLENSDPTKREGSHLSWPNDLNIYGKYVSFYAHEYKKPSRASDASIYTGASGTPASKISLPLPANLTNTYTQTYTDSEFGAVGDLVAKKLSDPSTQNSMIKRISDGVSGNLSSAMSGISAGGAIDLAKEFGMAAIADYFGSRTQDGGALSALSSSLGIARNPHMAVLYKNPNFRSFTFEYKMVAKNGKESREIKSIIDQLKSLSAPKPHTRVINSNNLLWDYPYIWMIQFSEQIEEHLFKFAPCVLKSIGINYHGEGQAQYFVSEGKKIPAVIILSLEFQEISVLLQDDHANGY